MKNYFKTLTFYHNLICMSNETIGISILLSINKVSTFFITTTARVYAWVNYPQLLTHN